MNIRRLLSLILFNALTVAGNTFAAEIRVAVASNFTETMKLIAERFERETGHKVIASSGSTGKHYAQIINGAPFDALFAADSEAPALLEAQNHALPGSRFTYALGKLVLWSPLPDYVDAEGKLLASTEIERLAMANPRLAPYGRAAQQVLQARGLWENYQDRLVRGENISQTFQFVASGNVVLGFVSLSQVQRPDRPFEGSLWSIPQQLYSPIEQQAVLLRDSAAARELLIFMRSPESLRTIHAFGYGTPDND